MTGRSNRFGSGDQVVEKCSFFTDGRDGKDRWGTPLKNKIACGTGWGDDQHVCPMYVEESCPGCRNKGNRIFACVVNSCDNGCDICGGGTRAETVAICGQKRSWTLDSWIGPEGEFPTLRLDQWANPDFPDERIEHLEAGAAAELPFDVSWFPVIRHNMDDVDKKTGKKVGTWMGALKNMPPIVCTGADFAWQVMEGQKKKKRKPGPRLNLRERLGVGPDTIVFVHGQVLDDALEKCWDAREEFFPWLLAEGVEGMIGPQFSTYPDLQNAMALLNVARIMDWYLDTCAAGFKYNVFQHPGFQADWLTQECYDFVARAGCKLVAFSTQTHGSRGGMIPEAIRDHRRAREFYPDDVRWLHFGTTTMLRMKMSAKLLGVFDEDRKIMFSNVVAAAGAAFFTLNPEKVSAPAGWTKGDVFAHNLEAYPRLADRVLGKGEVLSKKGQNRKRTRRAKNDPFRRKKQ